LQDWEIETLKARRELLERAERAKALALLALEEAQEHLQRGLACLNDVAQCLKAPAIPANVPQAPSIDPEGPIPSPKDVQAMNAGLNPGPSGSANIP
jgi:hypothetical protein